VSYGTAELLEGVVARARKLAADSEREDVASEVRELVGRSGLSKQDFAERVGTSRSRLSTYMSGKVVPSAALMVRIRRVVSCVCGSARRWATGPVLVVLLVTSGRRMVMVDMRYSQRKKRRARAAKTSAYAARTSSGAAGGKPVCIESWIASTAAPSGV
jgi:DNA-binding transcriptional regulator YiaG